MGNHKPDPEWMKRWSRSGRFATGRCHICGAPIKRLWQTLLVRKSAHAGPPPCRKCYLGKSREWHNEDIQKKHSWLAANRDQT